MRPWIFLLLVVTLCVASIAIQHLIVYLTSRWWVARCKFPPQHMIGKYRVVKKQTGRIGWFNFSRGLNLYISDLGIRIDSRKVFLPKLFLPWNQLQRIARSHQLAPGYDFAPANPETPASHVLIFDVDHPVAILISTELFQRISEFLPKVPVENYPIDAAWTIWDRRGAMDVAR